MLNNLFSAEVLQETLSIVQGQFLLAFWETLYVTIAAMFFKNRVATLRAISS